MVDLPCFLSPFPASSSLPAVPFTGTGEETKLRMRTFPEAPYTPLGAAIAANHRATERVCSPPKPGFRRYRFSETEGAQGHKKSRGCEPAALCEFLVNRLQTILRCRSSWRPNLTCSPPRPAHLSARINYRRVPSRISPPSDLFMHVYLEPVAGNTLRATTPTSYPDRGVCGSEDMSA